MKFFLKRLTGLLLMTIISTALFSQVRTVTGTVRGDDGKTALPGATVTVKGKSGSVVTGANGEFSIQAAEGDRLVISNVGYATQEIAVGSGSLADITLKTDASNLGEVVVVGYGTQSRRNTTSAIGKLDKAVLQNAPRANVGTALQGSIAGLRVINTTGSPGAAPAILLRGGASINSPGAPLVIVDGVIRSFNDISPDDIESMELLKDAASTAIYGARANNGVILITTKQGKAGKTEISYKFNYGVNKDRDDYTYLNAKDYIHYTRLGHLNSQRTLAQVNAQRGFGLSTSAADLALFDIRTYNASNQFLLGLGWDTVGDPYGGTIIFKDHSGEIKDIAFRDAFTRDHYINVQGGNDQAKYFASFDYYNEDGIIVGSDYERYTGSLNGTFRIKPKLELGVGAFFSSATGFGLLGGDVNTLYRNMSLWPTMNPWLDSAKTKPNPGNGLTDGNPLYWLNKNYRKNLVNRMTGNASLKYDIMKGLWIKASANLYNAQSENETFTKATQTYTQLYTTPQGFNTTRPATWSQSKITQQQYNLIINYNTTLGENHHLNPMIGFESFDQKSSNAQVSGTGAPTDDIVTVNASTQFAAGSNFTNRSEYRILSSFGRINYDYDNRYLLSLVYRYDGISSLSSDNRWGFFPGLSAGWNLHREKFYENSGLSKYLSTVKPRISYGINGNVAGIGDYEVQGVYGSQGNYNGSLGFLNTGVINSGLTWERSRTTDIGLDLGFLNNRITVIFDYYNRLTEDLLTNLALPSYLGFSSVRTNLGSFQNKGFELTVNANVLRMSNGLTLDLSANVAKNTNKIVALPFNGNENNRQGGFQVYDPGTGRVVWVTGLQEGQPLGAVYAYRQLAIFQNDAEIGKAANNRIDMIAQISGPGSAYGAGKITPGDVNWMDVDKNDTIDSRDQVYIGNINPKYVGGFSATLSFKGFSLYTRWDFATGHVLYNDLVARIVGNYQGTFNHLDYIKKGFSGDNSMPDIPKVYWADQVGAPNGKKNITRGNNAGQVLQSNNSRYYEKGDYLACREITLSYEFGKSLLSHTRVLNRARVYFNANNLFYITKFTGNSPEPTTNGIFAGTYPTPKSFVFGVQVTF